jgi:hypothetical protein
VAGGRESSILGLSGYNTESLTIDHSECCDSVTLLAY